MITAERAGLTSVRMIFSVLGYILGAALTTILVGIFEGQGMDTHQAWSATGAFFGIVAVVMILITTLTIKETGEGAGEPSQLPAFEGHRYIVQEQTLPEVDGCIHP